MLSRLKHRRFWMLLHRWIGIIILVFVVISGLTGSAIAFWRNIDSWLNPDLYQVAASEQRPSLDILSGIVQTQFPDSQIHGVILPAETNTSVIIYLANNPDGIDELFINPYNGDILGSRDNDLISLDKRHLLPFIYRLHYTLGLDHTGELILGIVAVLWLAMTFVGVWLAWPKKGKWRKALMVKTSASTSRMMFDLHRAGGLLVASFFIIILWTGLWWNMDYVMRPVVNALLPTTSAFIDKQPSITIEPDAGIEQAISIALDAKPSAKAYYVRFMPNKSLYTVYLRMPNEAGPYGRTFAFVSYRGELLHIDEPNDNLSGDTYTEWQFPLHTGQLLGLPGRVIWALIGLFPALLGITGIWLYLRKSHLLRTQRDQEKSKP